MHTRQFPISIAPTARLNRADNMRAMIADQRDTLADRCDASMAVVQWACVTVTAGCVFGLAVIAYFI